MNIRFEEKVVVITGGGGGIGAAMARIFAGGGATVVLCDIKGAPEAAAEIVRNNGNAVAMTLDVTDRGNVAEVCARIAAQCGNIDVWINNAGINVGTEQRRNVDEFSDAWWDAILNVDLNGVYNCSKAVVPYLKKSGGNLLNISSTTGIVPLRKQSAFVAAKGAVMAFSQAMAIELAEAGIRVNVIAPGSIGIAKTQLLWQDPQAMAGLLAHIPQHRQGAPEDVAHAAMFLCSDYAAYITGMVLKVDGGWTCGYTRDF